MHIAKTKQTRRKRETVTNRKATRRSTPPFSPMLAMMGGRKGDLSIKDFVKRIYLKNLDDINEYVYETYHLTEGLKDVKESELETSVEITNEDINEPNSKPFTATALTAAVQTNRLELVKKLLDIENVSSNTSDGKDIPLDLAETPEMYAALFKKSKYYKQLLSFKDLKQDIFTDFENESRFDKLRIQSILYSLCIESKATKEQIKSIRDLGEMLHIYVVPKFKADDVNYLANEYFEFNDITNHKENVQIVLKYIVEDIEKEGKHTQEIVAIDNLLNNVASIETESTKKRKEAQTELAVWMWEIMIHTLQHEVRNQK